MKSETPSFETFHIWQKLAHPTLEPWEVKAHAIIFYQSYQAWRRVNVREDGSRYKKNRPYFIPEFSRKLVKILGMHDREEAEKQAKTLFLEWNHGKCAEATS